MQISAQPIERMCSSCQQLIPSDAMECQCRAQNNPESSPFPNIPGYKIVNFLGQGGMGAVYLAEDLDLGRKVAIKIISPKLSQVNGALDRFEREARVMATVEHPHIVRVYTLGHFHGGSFLVLEYIEGESLAAYINRSKKLPLPEATRILRQIVEGLAATWSKKIVHRDIKPSNILLDKNADAHVTDFGLAKPIERQNADTLSFEGVLVGTPHYIAPEQALGQSTDFRADIYSLGIMFYEMLTGEKPFDGQTALEILNRQLTCNIPSIRKKRPDLPDRVVELLECMTQKKPNRRPQSYSVLLGALNSLYESRKLNSQAQTASLIQPLFLISQKWRIWMVLLLVATTGLFVLALKQKSREIQSPTKAEIVPSIAITPFYGPDEESTKEGIIMAALIEKTIHEKLDDQAHIIGVEQTRRPVRSHQAARALGNKLGTTMVIWGDVFVLRKEVEIDPHLTLVPAKTLITGMPVSGDLNHISIKERPNVLLFRSEGPNQIELRKTSADSISDMVSLLLGIHTLYGEKDPAKALTLFEQTPASPENLYYRASALIQLGKQQEAIRILREYLTQHQEHAPAHALLGDLMLNSGAFHQAVSEYKAAAEIGPPFSTALAFVDHGKLYKKETFRNSKYSSKKDLDTSWIIAVDPGSGKIINRYHLPGIPEVFMVRDGRVEILYNPGFGQQSKVLFENGKIDMPLYGEEDLLLRIQSMQSAWVLPSNFLTDLQNGENPGKAKFEVTEIIDKSLPQTLPHLEKALREAVTRDPTQPWHGFFLGQALWSQGHKTQAESIWKEITVMNYPHMCYYEFSWMASSFEGFGQKRWADFAYEQALQLRKNLPVRIESSTPMERMINASFLRTAAFATRNSADYSRGYLWLNRARELSGICPEVDQFAAALWGNHFRKQGDSEHARKEDELLRESKHHPLSIVRATTLLDYSLYCCLAASAAYLIVVFLLFFKALRCPPAYRENVKPVLTANKKLRRVLYAFLAILIFVALNQIIRNSGLEMILAAIAMCGLVAATLHSKKITIRSVIGCFSLPQRRLFILTFILLVATVVITVHENTIMQGLSRRPVIPSDIRESPALLEYMEQRMTDSDTGNIRFVTAVLNQKAGNLERAQELYRSIERYPGVQQNLMALQNGNQFDIKEPSAAELRNAFTDISWLAAFNNVWNPGKGANIFLSGTDVEEEADTQESISSLLFQMVILFSLGLMLLFLFIPPMDKGEMLFTTRKQNGFFVKCISIVIPGAFDIERERPVLGYAVLLFFLIAAGGMLAQWMIPTRFPVPGFATFLQASSYLNLHSFPTPVQDFEIHTIAPHQFWPVFWSYPYAAIFWGFLVTGGCLALLLHMVRLRTIWREL